MKNSKKNKKITKASKRRLMTIGLVCIGIFAYFCFTVVSYTHKIISLSNEEKRLTVKLDQLKTEKENLLNDIKKLQDPEELAKFARETYHYSKDGELVLKIETKEELDTISEEIKTVEKNKEDIEKLSSKYKYIIIFGSGLLTLIITIHIIRNKMSQL